MFGCYCNTNALTLHRTNYIDTVLKEIDLNEPNETTLAAMREAEKGLFDNTPSLDLSSIETMDKSIGL